MDFTNSNNSPALSEVASSWPQYWANEINSITGSNTELSNIVEDKEIAARAVAFVVNSTRKGIVPLCADVAHLLRTKKSLEKKVYLLKKENGVIQSDTSSLHNSQSTSPIPTSLSSDKDRYRPCSRCSQNSSSFSSSPKCDISSSPKCDISSSPKCDNRQRLGVTSLQNSPRISHDNLLQRHNTSPRFHRTRSFTRKEVQNQISVESFMEDELDHSVSNKGQGHLVNSDLICNSSGKTTLLIKDSLDKRKLSDVSMDTENTDQDYEWRNSKDQVDTKVENKPINEKMSVSDVNCKKKILQRKNSLPEIVSTVDRDVIKVRPRSTESNFSSKIIPISCLEEQFAESVRLNSKLTADLDVAHKEIENLKSRLKEMELKQSNKHCTEGFYMEDECYRSQQKSSEEIQRSCNGGRRLSEPFAPQNNHYSLQSRYLRNSCTRNNNRLQMISPLYPEPIAGCKCSACHEAIGSDLDLSADFPPAGCQPFSVSHKLQIQLNDYVTAKGDHTGYIRYIGHLDGVSQPNTLYVGLELDSIGEHDGFFKGKRYFYCQKKTKSGVFIPIQEIMCKIGRKLSRKSFTFDGLEKLSSSKIGDFSNIDSMDRSYGDPCS